MFENIPISSKRNPKIIESDDGGGFVKKLYTDFQKKNNIKRCGRCSSLGSVFAERFNPIIRDLLEKPVFQRSRGKEIDVLPTITKRFIYCVHISTKLTPIQASLEENEEYVLNI